jgi:hypothetical protein
MVRTVPTPIAAPAGDDAADGGAAVRGAVGDLDPEHAAAEQRGGGRDRDIGARAADDRDDAEAGEVVDEGHGRPLTHRPARAQGDLEMAGPERPGLRGRKS